MGDERQAGQEVRAPPAGKRLGVERQLGRATKEQMVGEAVLVERQNGRDLLLKGNGLREAPVKHLLASKSLGPCVADGAPVREGVQAGRRV